MNSITATPRRGLFGSTLGFFVGFAAVALVGPAAKRFQEIMHLGPPMVALLAAAPNLSGSLLRIPFGAWVDTSGGRKPFLVLLLASIVGMCGLTWLVYARYPDELTIRYYWLLFFLGALSGCGIATFSVGIGQVSYWFPQSHQGRALGTYAGLGNMAPGIFSFLLPVSLVGWGLAGSYLAWLAFLAVGTGIYYFIGSNAPYFQCLHSGMGAQQALGRARQAGQEIFPSGNAVQSIGKAAENPRTWALTVIYFTTFGGFLALTTWLPTYWATLHGQGLKVAGLLTALFSLTCSIARIFGGSLSDRLGGQRTMVISLLIMLAGAAFMTVARTVALAAPAEFIMALGMGICNAAVFKLLPLHVGEAVGGAAGIVGGLGAFGGFAIPPLMGLLAKALGMTGYALGFIIFIALAILSLAMVRLLRIGEPAVIPLPATAHPPGGGEGDGRPAARSPAHLRVSIIISLVVTAFGATLLASSGQYAWIGNQTGYSPPQPIEFSHKTHAKDYSISCEYCHFGARRGPVAGIPPANVCMNCHSEAGRNLPGVKKLVASFESGRPIEWVRIYDLPDFVYFDHSAHLSKGVTCQQCHGLVQEMPRIVHSRHLTMGWCVKCHRQYTRHPPKGAKDIRASAECSACHF